MKNTLVPIIFGALIMSCDKVEQPYENPVSSEVDQSLYPDDWANYPWPDFTQNTNTDRNILLEDYTGHTCVFCPAAADIAAQLETANPGRVFVASIHASPGGLGDFQKPEPPDFVHDFTTPEGLQYGATFESGYGFNGNPRGTINRKVIGTYMFQAASNWANGINTVLAENELLVNLQSKVNYYPETRGLFLHTEIDTMATEASDISLVVYLIEESFISPQKKPGETDYEYYHHNVHRGNIDGLSFGRQLTSGYRKDSGKYQVDMSYRLPEQYAADNCHLLVYAMHPDTYEIYQVIKVNIP